MLRMMEEADVRSEGKDQLFSLVYPESRSQRSRKCFSDLPDIMYCFSRYSY